ncbi:MAG: proton-conducting transporter membrane subunit [Anaerolineae bacterium]
MGFDVISEFLTQAFADRNLMLWLVPLGPLTAFALISLITMLLWLVRQVTGGQENMIPASDPHYNDHNHPDYGGMPVPYQPDWFRVTAVIIGMSGVIWALIFSWTLVFGSLNQFGAGTFGLVDSAAYHGDDDHTEATSTDDHEEETHGPAEDCAPCVYGHEIVWMSLGTPDSTYGLVPDEDTDYEIGVLLDPLNLTLLFMVPIAMLGIFTYSIGYMAHDARQAKFFALISLFAGAMFILTLSDNLMMMFVGWEIMGFCSYSLIGFWYEKRSAYNAAIKAFTVTRVADVLMLLGIVYLWNIAGTLNFRDILANPDVLQMVGSTPAIIFGSWGLSAAGLIGVLLVIGTIGKSAQFPLHVWLPDAMEGPTPVSAMIHAAAMVSAGIYAIIRMYPLFVGLTNPHASEPTFSAPLILLAVIGSFTALFAATMGVAQRDVKAVLAYSTISQLGFMAAALGVGAYIAATFHLITHAFFKALLFMASGSVIHAMEHGEHHVHEHHAAHGHDDHHDEVDAHSPPPEHGVEGVSDVHHAPHFDPQDMFNMGGLSKKIPVTFWTFLAGGLSLAGFPLITAGFWSKDEILAESWYGFASHGSGLHALVFFMLAIAAFLTAFYTMRQIALTFLGEPRTEEAEHANLGGPYNIVSITMQAPLILLAFFAVFAGFIGVPEDFPLFGAIFSPEHNYFHHLVVYALPFMENGGYEVFHVDAPAFNIIPVAASFVVALGGLWLGWMMYGRKPLEAGEEDPLIKYLGQPIYSALQKRYYMDDLYDLVFVRPARWLARGVISLLDKGIIDSLLHGLGWLFTVIGDFIKMMNAWLIDGVGDGIPKGIYQLGGWMRGVQNGRIQFYLLIVLAAVLIIGVIFAISFGTMLAS